MSSDQDIRISIPASIDADNASDEDEYDEDACRFPGCPERLDDGEGYDGWCGTHADRIQAHDDAAEDGEELDPHHDRNDCPVCLGHTRGFGD